MKRNECRIGTKVRYRFYNQKEKKSYSYDGVIAPAPFPDIAMPFDERKVWVQWDDVFRNGDFIAPSALSKRA